MTASYRSSAILIGLCFTIAAAATFLFATEGFYGSPWRLIRVLNAETLAEADDVYRCASLNGLGSDDGVGVIPLLLLTFLLPLRALRFSRQPNWAEVALFIGLSAPAFFLLSTSYCANLALTVIVGMKVAIVAVAVGWVGTLVVYLWPSAALA